MVSRSLPLFQTLTFLLPNKCVKSVSSSCAFANDESVGLGGERCAHISGIYGTEQLVTILAWAVCLKKKDEGEEGTQ